MKGQELDVVLGWDKEVHQMMGTHDDKRSVGDDNILGEWGTCPVDSSHLHELSEGTGMFGLVSFLVKSELLYILREKEEVMK